jgi:hypothetical protein
MSELGDVAGGETVTAAFTNDVKNRTVMRYANAAARDASIPVPVEGDLAYLQDVNRITYYDGSAPWLVLASQDNVEAIRVHTNQAAVSTGVNGEFAVATGFTPSTQYCQGAQVAAPSVIVLQSASAVEVIWRAFNAVDGDPLALTTIDVTYTIWGPLI